MNKKRLFNILLPTFKSKKYLKPLLKSLANQTIKDFLIITYDDNSEDNTIKVFDQLCKKYKLKYKRIPSSHKNIGPIKSYERLINKSDSKYIAFCDHDDIWLPEKLSLHLLHFKEINQQKPALSIANATITNLNTLHKSLFKYMRINDNYFKSRYSLALRNKVPGICMSFNLALKELILPIDKNVAMHDWWTLLVAKTNNADIRYTNEIGILYRQHKNNTIGLKKKDKGINFKRIKFLIKNLKLQLKTIKKLNIFSSIEFLYFILLRILLALKNI